MLTLNNEIIRKLIHLSTAIIPIFYFFSSRFDVLIILVPSTIIFAYVDFYRRYNIKYKKIYKNYFGWLTRDEENKTFTGATCALFACVITIFFFNKEIAITALLIMSISDSMAAVIGKRYGVIDFLNKSLEGSIAFFMCSLFIILFASDLNILVAILSILVVTAIEASRHIGIDDNIAVPISFAIIYLSLYNILRPFMI